MENKTFKEMDLKALHDFLDGTLGENAKYSCQHVRVTDNICFIMKMLCPRVFIDTLNENNWKLHVDDDITVFEALVDDDSNSTFCIEDDGSFAEIVVKPSKESSIEVRMIFTKQSNWKSNILRVDSIWVIHSSHLGKNHIIIRKKLIPIVLKHR